MADSFASPQDDSLRMLLEDLVDSAASSGGVDVHRLPPGTVLDVRTRRSSYRLEVCDGDRGLVTARGGRVFPREVLTRLNGSTYGGGMIKAGWVVAGLRLEFERDFRRVLTSPVVSVDVIAPATSAAR
jgi:hypothetical protein